MLAQLSAEGTVQSEAASEMNLETLDLIPGPVVDQQTLEADVCDLRPRARVGAAVDVDRDRNVEPTVDVGQALFELRYENL